MEDIKQSTVTSEQSTVEQKTPNSFLVILLSILLIISCLIAGFFAYQTQNLVKEITKIKSIPTPTATSTPTPDPTTDWKTYTNTKYNFSLKYPSEWKIRSFAGSQMSVDVAQSISLETGESDSIAQVSVNVEGGVGSSNFKNDWLKKGFDVTSVPMFGEDLRSNPVEEYILEKKNNQFYPDKFIIATIPLYGTSGEPGYVEFYNFDVNDSEVFNQILSTFKFIEPEANASPLPVVCTMEAKLCPDGSAVGRFGPKCEFAPCPTSKN